MTDSLHDVRLAIRTLGRRPGASLFAVVALTVAIGLTTTMFAVVEGVVLRGLPFEDSDNLVALVRGRLDSNSRQSVPMYDFLDWRASQTSFEDLDAYQDESAVATGAFAWPEPLKALRVTPGLMRSLRAAPMLGRDFIDADAAPGAAPVALISFRQWQSGFGGKPDVIGSPIRLNGTPTTVIGVMPENFGFRGREDVWMPLTITRPATRGGGPSLGVIGRLRPGVDLDAASAELAVIAKRLADSFRENDGWTVRMKPLAHDVTPDQIRAAFYTMLAAVIGVLLIACVNIANMQLARAAERTAEYAVRSALGSGRWRLLRQALIEGLLLSVCGAAFGLLLAHFGTAYVMTAIAEVEPPFWIGIRINGAVLAFVLAITAGATLVSSLAPGLRVSRIDPGEILKSHAQPGAGLHIGRFGRWLLVGEVAVSCALLVVSGLMIRGIVAGSRLEHPFATRDVLHAQTRLEGPGYENVEFRAQRIAELESHLSAVPGVRRVAVSTTTPGTSSVTSLAIEGRQLAAPAAARVAVSPGFFEVLGVGLLEGRIFASADDAAATRVAIVDATFAERFLSPASAIGRRVRFDGEKEDWLTVIGVVPSLGQRTEAGQTIPAVYVPFAQAPSQGFVILARTAGDPLLSASHIRTAAAKALPDAPLVGVNSLAGLYWQRGWASRLFGGLFLFFGAAALLFAAAGLYGVMAFMVRRRTPEIGLRMALGASRQDILRMVMRQGLARVALGIAIGLWPGWLAASLMRELLPGIGPGDPIVYASAVLVLGGSGMLATLVPARRASSVDPLTALRNN